MALVPGRLMLERHGRADKRRLVVACQLETNWQTAVAEAARQGHGGMTGEVERCRIALQLEDQLRLVAECADVGERERREGLHRNDQGVDRPEQMREASAQLHAPQPDGLVVECR